MTLLELFDFALKNYEKRISIFPFDGLLVDAVRSNDKRTARITLATMDDVVMNLKGKDGLRDTFMVVRIPREVVDRAMSPIIAPGEQK